MSRPTEYKSLEAYPEIKTSEEGDQGIVEHLISVFGILDLGRDVCHVGSFTKTITERAGRVRVVDTHRRSSIMSALGVPLKIWEISRSELPQQVQDKYPEATGGVKALTQFLLDTPEGAGAFARIKAGAVDEFSFSYDTLDENFTKGADGKQVRNLRTIRLWEYGPVLFGMNPATEVVDVKSGEKVVTEGEKTLRIRVNSQPLFEEESLETITLGKKVEGIKAVIGRLKEETSTTVQSFLFDKTKWTAAEAQKWTKDKAISYTQEIREVRAAFRNAYERPDGTSTYWIKEVFDGFLVVEDYEAESSYYQVNYTKSENTISFTPRGEWVVGKYIFVAESASTPDDQGDQAKMLEIEIELEQMNIELAKAGPGQL